MKDPNPIAESEQKAPPAVTWRSRKAALFLGLATMALGAMVLGGWALDVDGLKTVFPGLVTMKANTSLAVALCGAALALLARKHPGKFDRRGVTVLAAGVIAIGALTLAQYFGGWDLHIDQALFRDAYLNKISTSSPGRMAPISALSFVFLGLALQLAARPSPARWRDPVISALAGAVGMIGTVAFFGCLLRLATGNLWWDYTGLAVHTAAAFVMLGGGILAWIRSEHGLPWSLDARTSGGFALAVALMVTMAGVSFGFTSKLRESDAWVSHTHEVLARLQEVSTDAMELQSQQRGYFITGDPQLLERYRKAVSKLRLGVVEVRLLTRDNPAQQLRVDRLEPLIFRRIEWSDQNISAYQQGGFAAAQQRILTGTGIALSDQIRALIQEIEDEERRLLREREIQSGPLATKTFLLLPLGVFFSLTLLFLGLSLLNADVAARQQAEAERRKLAQLIEHSRDFIAMSDLDGRLTFINRGARRMIGLPEEQDAGTLHFTDYVPPEWQQFFREKVIATAREQGLWEGEMQLRQMQTGALVDVIRSTFLLRDAAGQPSAFATVTRDITERKQAEATLRESEARLLKMFLSCPVGVAIHRWSDRTFVDINAAFAELTGWTREEVVGKTADELSIVEESAARTEVRARLAAHLTVRNVEMTIKTRRNEPRFVLLSTDLVELRGETHSITTFVDITDRKRAEERALWLATFPERNPNPIIELDLAGGVFHYLNSAARGLFPDLESEGLRHPLLAGLPEAAEELADKGTLRREIAVGELFLTQTVTYIAEARRIRIYSADITERRNAELALHEKEAQLHAADRRLAEIVQGMTEACFALDREWRFTFVNDRTETLLRHRREELLGRTIWEVFHKLVGTPMEKNYRRAMAEQTPVSFEAYSPIAERWLDIRLFPTSDGLAAFLLDIRSRKMAESALRASEERLRLITNLVPHGIFAKDAAGRYIFVNRALADGCGMSIEQILGKTDFDLVSDRTQAEAYRADDAAVIESGIAKFIPEERNTDLSGRTRFLQTTKVPFTVPETGERALMGVWIDITERKHADEALRESEERLQAVTENLTEGLVISDLDGQVLHWNRAGLKMCGYASLEEGMRKLPEFADTFVHAIPGGVVLQLDQWPLSRVLQGETLRNEEISVSRRDMDWERIFSYSGTIVLDASGKPLAFLAITDITARKQAETAVRASEEYFRFLNDLSEATRTLADPAQIMAETARMLGEHLRVSRCAYADVEQDGEHFTILHDYTDGCASTAGHYELSLFGPRAVTTLHRGQTLIIRDVLAELSPGEGAEMFQAIGIQAIITCPLVKDGRLRAMMAVHQADPRDWKPGEITMVQEVIERCWATIERRAAEEKIYQLNAELEQRVIDRTTQLEAANVELRHSRAELNSLFESLPGLYLVLTPEFNIVAASDAYLKATMTTREGILGRGLFEVFPDNPEEAAATGVSNLRASLNRVLLHAGADTMAIQKYDVRRPDGVFEEHYWSPVNSPVFGANRQIKFIVHRVEEVTDFVRQKSKSAADGGGELSARLQQMEAEIFQSSRNLQAANRQLEDANKELEAFSYSVSHDLRAPLRAVDGFSQALLEDYTDRLPEEGQRLLQTIRGGAQKMGALIDDLLTFSRLSRRPLKTRDVNTARLVQDSIDELAPQRAGRQIEIRIGDLPVSLADPALLKQVWINLLSNAFKYTGKRPAAVVEIGCTSAAGEHVFFVRDNGTGFNMRFADKLFGVFQRLHRAEDYEGTGVGLAIVQRIVHRHGGRIWAESEDGLGATFYFTVEGKANS